MKKISDKGIALIKEFEGCKLSAYKCVPTEKYYTIGWGHYGPDVRKEQKISQMEADLMFLVDIEEYVNYVNNKNYVPLTDSLNQNQFDALVSFCYNCGAGNLKTLCKNRSIAEISNSIPKYNKSGGKVLNGLVKRRAKDIALFDTPVKTSVNYYPACSNGYKSIVDALNSIGVNSSLSNRKNIAKKNNISTSDNYSMNVQLLKLLKAGKLISF